MDPKFLKYYNQELDFIRRMGGEFAEEFPKIAGRLGLDSFECSDPYVERLLEGFAFLAARVQLKVDAGFPRFTQHLLQMVYPHYLSSLPSMTIVQMQPNLGEGSLVDGVQIPRGSQMRSNIGKGEQTACEYRTAHDLTLWPLELVEAKYLDSANAVANLGVPGREGVKAGLRLRLRSTAGLLFNQLPIKTLPIFLRGGDVAFSLYEQLMANTLAFVVQPAKPPVAWHEVLPASSVKPLGFDDEQSLLPYSTRSFQGYRLLQEYFAMPERFLFFELNDLKKAFKRCDDNEVDLIFLLNRCVPGLADLVGTSHFNLFCTPAINLFAKRADRIHLTHATAEYHIVPDRTRPMDFEVYDVNEVLGFGSDAEPKQEFLPFYQLKEQHIHREQRAYYMLTREQRRLSVSQRRKGARSSYIGSEIFISLVDAEETPFSSGLKQLGLKLLCTNRDLPLQMPVGVGLTDFSLQAGAPVHSIRCLAGPTRPRTSNARQETAWHLISQLSLNYLSLAENTQEEGAPVMRQLLKLYSDSSDPHVRKQTEGLLSISSNQIISPIISHIHHVRHGGPIAFGRGLEVTLTFDESAFEGSGVYLLGTVLEHFLCRYVSINSFTETVLKTTDRGEIARWPARIGKRHQL
jgi:type VI secretion system protein ImpG